MQRSHYHCTIWTPNQSLHADWNVQDLAKEALLKQLDGRNPTPPRATSWLSGLARARRAELACWVLFALRENGLEVNTFHYTAAISACENTRKWQLALVLLTEMCTVSVVKNTFTYNAAISACEKGQQADRKASCRERVSSPV